MRKIIVIIMLLFLFTGTKAPNFERLGDMAYGRINQTEDHKKALEHAEVIKTLKHSTTIWTLLFDHDVSMDRLPEKFVFLFFFSTFSFFLISYIILYQNIPAPHLLQNVLHSCRQTSSATSPACEFRLQA